MRKPRYTKTEKAFMDAMHQIIWQKGVKTLADSKPFHQLPDGVQKAYIQLLMTKTRQLSTGQQKLSTGSHQGDTPDNVGAPPWRVVAL